jgi:hypothetical protein
MVRLVFARANDLSSPSDMLQAVLDGQIPRQLNIPHWP